MDAKRAILRYIIMEFQKMKDKFLQVPREREKNRTSLQRNENQTGITFPISNNGCLKIMEQIT